MSVFLSLLDCCTISDVKGGVGWGGGGGRVVLCIWFVLIVIHHPPMHLRMPFSHLQVLLFFLSILSCLAGCSSWVPMESETRHDTNEMCSGCIAGGGSFQDLLGP